MYRNRLGRTVSTTSHYLYGRFNHLNQMFISEELMKIQVNLGQAG